MQLLVGKSPDSGREDLLQIHLVTLQMSQVAIDIKLFQPRGEPLWLSRQYHFTFVAKAQACLYKVPA
jgi:hypothetical protein